MFISAVYSTQDMEEIADIKLINLVKKYSLLYDVSHQKYLKKKARRIAWDEIGVRLDTSGNACKKQWTSLRNAYSNTLRRRRINPNTSKWRLEDQMSFLEAHGPRSTDCGESEDETIRTSENSVADVSDMNFKISLLAPPTEPLSAPAIEPMPATSHNNSPRIYVQTPRNQQVVEMERTKEECVRQDYAKDETEMLFLSLSRSVKKLNPMEQARVKKEIANAVFHAEFRHCIKPDPCDILPNSPASDE